MNGRMLRRAHMKNNSVRLLYIILAIGCFQAVVAQWVQTNGPFGGNVYCIAAKGDTVFAGTGGGFYRSFDNCTSWTTANDGMPVVWSFGSLAIKGNVVFAATADVKGISLFRSTDNGTRWAAANAGLPGALTISDLIIRSDTVYAATMDGLFFSADFGTKWAADTGMPRPTCLVESNGRIYAGTPEGVFFSSGAGVGWTKSDSGLPEGAVHAIAASGGDLYIGVNYDGVFRSSDNGLTWTAATTGLPNTSPWTVNKLATRGDTLFAGMNCGIYRSADHGASWTKAVEGISLASNSIVVYSLAVSGRNVFAGTLGKGIFRSGNNGTNWTAINNGIVATAVSLAVIGDTLFAGTNLGCFLSAANGTGWTLRDSTSIDYDSKPIGASGGSLFIKNQYSDDHGMNWKRIDPTQSGAGVDYVITDGRGNLFAESPRHEVFFSTDNGTNWIESETKLPDITVSLLAATSGAKFAGTDKGVLVSTDNFKSWTTAANGLSATSSVRGLVVKGGKVFAGTEGGVFISTDDGASWASARTGLPTPLGLSCMLASGDALFLGTFDGTVYVSLNEGQRWSNITSNLKVSIIRSLVVCGDDLFIGTDANGVWRRPVSEMTPIAKDVSHHVLKDKQMRHHYTHGVDRRPVLEFTLSQPERVVVAFYDFSGKQVLLTVYDCFSGGEHRIPINARNLSTGCYMIKIQTGSGSGTWCKYISIF
jgi:hypothetical protein